jgi:hypothetical protein
MQQWRQQKYADGAEYKRQVDSGKITPLPRPLSDIAASRLTPEQRVARRSQRERAVRDLFSFQQQRDGKTSTSLPVEFFERIARPTVEERLEERMTRRMTPEQRIKARMMAGQNRRAAQGRPEREGVTDENLSAGMRRERQGLRSGRSDAYYQPDDDPEFEKEFERQWERFRDEMGDRTVEEVGNSLPTAGWIALDEWAGTVDREGLGPDGVGSPVGQAMEDLFDKPVKDLPEEWQRAIKKIAETAFNDNWDALLEMDELRRGQPGPDPYDVQQDRHQNARAVASTHNSSIEAIHAGCEMNCGGIALSLTNRLLA